MRRSLAITAAVLGLIWIVATGVLLFYIADLVPIQALLLAFVAMDSAFGLLLAVYLVTNTRRPYAIDPYAQTTDELLRDAVMVGDRPYGRRANDDRDVVARLSDILEEEASKRPGPANTPAWAVEIHRQHTPDDTTPGEL